MTNVDTIILEVNDTNVRTLLLGLMARIELLEQNTRKNLDVIVTGQNDLQDRIEEVETNQSEIAMRIEVLEKEPDTNTDTIDLENRIEALEDMNIEKLKDSMEDLENRFDDNFGSVESELKTMHQDMDAIVEKSDKLDREIEKLDKDLDCVNAIFSRMQDAITPRT